MGSRFARLKNYWSCPDSRRAAHRTRRARGQPGLRFRRQRMVADCRRHQPRFDAAGIRFVTHTLFEPQSRAFDGRFRLLADVIPLNDVATIKTRRPIDVIQVRR